VKVLVVGSGGREHALAWKIAQSSLVDRLFCAPGNAGTGTIAENISIKAEDIQGIVRFASENSVDLAVIGPEDPLAAGIADRLREAGVRTFGPSAAAAQIEADKEFSKNLMAASGIPTARYQAF